MQFEYIYFPGIRNTCLNYNALFCNPVHVKNSSAAICNTVLHCNVFNWNANAFMPRNYVTLICIAMHVFAMRMHINVFASRNHVTRPSLQCIVLRSHACKSIYCTAIWNTV